MSANDDHTRVPDRTASTSWRSGAVARTGDGGNAQNRTREGRKPIDAGGAAGQRQMRMHGVPDSRRAMNGRDGQINGSGKYRGTNARGQASGSVWSATVWDKDRGQGGASGSGQAAPQIESQPSASGNAIGLGRATGLSRVPDATLASSPALIQARLDNLMVRLRTLEHKGMALIDNDVSARTSGSKSTNPLNQWEPLLAEFRQLTMGVTACSAKNIDVLAIRVYEGAADACLLAGNLSFYLACQTRLLQELYNTECLDVTITARRTEFTAYSLLYFGVFCVDNREIARILRGLSAKRVSSLDVQFAFSAIQAFSNSDGPGYIALYKQASARQRTILSMSLCAMRTAALSAIVRSYMALEKTHALSLLGFASEAEFLNLLQSQRPDLVGCNAGDDLEFHFRAQRGT